MNEREFRRAVGIRPKLRVVNNRRKTGRQGDSRSGPTGFASKSRCRVFSFRSHFPPADLSTRCFKCRAEISSTPERAGCGCWTASRANNVKLGANKCRSNTVDRFSNRRACDGRKERCGLRGPFPSIVRALSCPLVKSFDWKRTTRCKLPLHRFEYICALGHPCLFRRSNGIWLNSVLKGF